MIQDILTKKKFIYDYCKYSKIDWEELCKVLDAIPCDCRMRGCKGWVMVSKKSRMIKTHMKLYVPKSESGIKIIRNK